LAEIHRDRRLRMSEKTLEDRAAAVIEANKYMTIATVDEAGHPWAAPVYFTPNGHTAFYWVSSPDSQHSENIARNPEVSIVIYDSSVAIGQAEAVYVRGQATQVPDDELPKAAELYASRYPELRKFSPEELHEPAALRLYRATATKHWVLVRGSDPDYGTGVDTRLPVWTT
jgi:nitroimidazol reductase NimA-like FMN-containing flavoprotein (pyridoxamine 5'-phosphate oxidase superfamily)